MNRQFPLDAGKTGKEPCRDVTIDGHRRAGGDSAPTEVEGVMSYVVFHVATKRSDRSLKKEIASYQGDSAMGEYLRIQEMLREGESYAGLILGKDGEPDYHLVLLPE